MQAMWMIATKCVGDLESLVCAEESMRRDEGVAPDVHDRCRPVVAENHCHGLVRLASPAAYVGELDERVPQHPPGIVPIGP